MTNRCSEAIYIAYTGFSVWFLKTDIDPDFAIQIHASYLIKNNRYVILFDLQLENWITSTVHSSCLLSCHLNVHLPSRFLHMFWKFLEFYSKISTLYGTHPSRVFLGVYFLGFVLISVMINLAMNSLESTAQIWDQLNLPRTPQALPWAQ